jgi:putative redox protein
MSSKVTVNWAGKRREGGQPITTFEVHSASGHTVVVDEPPVFGDDLGMRPTELLLGALGACTSVNAVLLLKKYKQPYRSLQVEVEGDQDEEWPKAFKTIRITFSIAWDGEFDEALVEEALDQACNQYCPVDATLTHGTRIEVQHKYER